MRDPELRYAANGTAVGNFTIAVSHKWKPKDGEEKKETAFIECSAFGKQAEAIGQYVRKGHLFMVEGRLVQDDWEDKETGKKRSKLRVQVKEFTFMPNKDDGERSEEAHKPVDKPAPKVHAPKAKATTTDDDDNSDAPF